MSRGILGSGSNDLNRWGRNGLGPVLLRMGLVTGLMVGVALLSVPAALASEGASRYTTLSIAVGSLPEAVAVNQSTDTVYAANSVSNTVSVIDGATNTVTATIAVGSLPEAVAVDGNTDTIYTPNFGSNTVSVIDGATDGVTDTVTVGSAPVGVAVDQITDTVYAANDGSNTVSVINPANMVTATVTVGSEPYGVAVDETTDTVYAANNGSATVSVIDGATNAVSAPVTVGTDPYGVAVDETTDTIYIANGGSDTVSVIIPSTVNVSPTSGSPGTSVTISGRGFKPGETVKITYKTGLASPTSVAVCTATAGSDTSYSCSGTIPPRATAGAHNAHKIVAKGQTSHIKVKTNFTLT